VANPGMIKTLLSIIAEVVSEAVKVGVKSAIESLMQKDKLNASPQVLQND
jgi:hypothetical protein